MTDRISQMVEMVEEETRSKDRKSLQTYLKANGLPASGTTAILRETYREARRSELGLASNRGNDNNNNNDNGVIDLTGDTPPQKAPPVAAAAKKKAPPNSDRKRAAASSESSEKPGDEKRLRRYRATCSAAVKQRIQRAKTQRLYLVEPPKIKPSANNSNNNHFDMVVMGSTGNLYTVTLSNLVHCTCPDHAKGNVCKHILFVMIKVIGLPDMSPLVYQTALITTELDYIATRLQRRMMAVGRTNNDGVMANARVQRAYQEMTSPKSAAATENNKDNNDNDGGVKRQPIDDASDCPICFDEMKSQETLVYCRAVCGANFHQACMAKWMHGKRSTDITCPNCRSPWEDEKKKASLEESPEGYANMGQLQGISSQRDTSSYSEWYGYHNRTAGGGGSGGRRRRW